MKRLLTGMVVLAALSWGPGTAAAQSTVDLSLVHGIPGSTVDVLVDGDVVINDFLPGSIADISSFAGQPLTNLAVVDATTGDAVIGPVAQFTVPTSGSWSIVAHLDAAGTAVLSSFENNVDALDQGEARLTVRHTAEAGAVDLIVDGQRPITGAVNGNSAELELPVGQLTGAQLAPTGGTASFQLATINLDADTNTIVYVVGSLDDDTIDFVLQVVRLPAPATATTTTVAGATTTTAPVPTPIAVNTGSPLDGTANITLILVSVTALLFAGAAVVARRRL